MFVVGFVIGKVVPDVDWPRRAAGEHHPVCRSTVLTAFNSVLVAVGYYYLRAEKEGTDVNEIARIFD